MPLAHQSSQVTPLCKRTIWLLSLIYAQTLAEPGSCSLFAFLSFFSSSLLFSVHPYFSVYWYSSCSSTSASQERKTLHKLVQNLKLSVVIDTGCETENYPPLSFLFLLFLGVRGYQLTIPQTMNPLWQDCIDYQRHCCLSGPRQPYRKNINYGFLRCRASQQDFVMCKKILKKACEQIW